MGLYLGSLISHINSNECRNCMTFGQMIFFWRRVTFFFSISLINWLISENNNFLAVKRNKEVGKP